MEFKDYYAILGVDPTADDTAIKMAYRRLARKYHPDVSDHQDAEKQFKDVAEAYQVLKDTDKRADYDQLRAYRAQQRDTPFEPPPDWQPSGGFRFTETGPDAGFSEFFESIFGASRRAQAEEHARPARGHDLEMELPVFLEKLFGREPHRLAFRVPRFDAHGRNIGNEEKTLSVTLPAGVADGELIRLKGQGVAGIGNAPAGDLFVRVRLVPHPLFDVEAHNLIVTVPLAPWEAALGARIEIPTLSGNIALTVPSNSQSGQKLRIRGKGLPGKAGPGDLHAVLNVVMPQTADDEQKALWEELGKRSAFDPRSKWRK